jgi:ADP-heptose:LPS heptosyltransferase
VDNLLKMRSQLNADHRFGNPLPQTIAIVRALPGLGDLLCWVPALRALRMALPDAQITWIGLLSSAHLMQRFRCYLNQWLPFPGYPGIPEVPISPQQTVSFLMQAQQLNFDLALQMHGSGAIINGFTLLLGAKRSAVFFPSEQACPDGGYLPYPEHESEVWRHLRLMEFLGVPLQGDHLEFPLWQSDWDEWDAIVSAYNLHPGSYICIHPGASVREKRWAYPNFAMIADRLAAQGFQIVLTGTATEVELTQAIAQTMRFPSIDLAGQTSLGGMAALLSQAQLLICNDTGISHLAAALQVKSVVIFSNSDPHRWAPLNRQRHRVFCQDWLNDWSGRTAEQTVCGPAVDAILAIANNLLEREVVYAF